MSGEQRCSRNWISGCRCSSCHTTLLTQARLRRAVRAVRSGREPHPCPSWASATLSGTQPRVRWQRMERWPRAQTDAAIRMRLRGRSCLLELPRRLLGPPSGHCRGSMAVRHLISRSVEARTLDGRAARWCDLAERRAAVIPAPTTSILGRRAELVRVTDLLWNPDVRLVSLLGPGGIGKTRLAVEVAWELHAGPGFARAHEATDHEAGAGGGEQEDPGAATGEPGDVVDDPFDPPFLQPRSERVDLSPRACETPATVATGATTSFSRSIGSARFTVTALPRCDRSVSAQCPLSSSVAGSRQSDITTARWARRRVAASTRPTASSKRSSGNVVKKSTAKRSSAPGRHGDSSAAIVAMLGATIARAVN